MADVDAVLAHARKLLGTGEPPGWPSRTFGAPVASVPSWSGVAAERAHVTSDLLNGRRQAINNAYDAVGPLVGQAAQISTGARQRLDAIQQQWQADKTAFAPIANTPAGRLALLQLGQLRISEAAAVIRTAQSSFATLAAGVRTATGGLPVRGEVQMLDHGGLPQSPRVPFPLAPWEYNIDLTSDVEAGSFKYPGVRSAGQVTSIEDAWNELSRCFNCNFPMGGAPSELPKVGDDLPLEIRIAGQQAANFPVRVTQIAKTGDEINIEFVTLPGHVDGPGSTIHFRFYEQGGQLHLGIRGVITEGPGSWDIPVVDPLARTGYTQVAYGVWQPYIDRLTRHVAQGKGLNVYGGSN